MPPVMGASAFLIAAFLGIPYVTVMLVGFTPAILYYIAVFIGVEIIARKGGIKPMVERVNLSRLLRRSPMFIIPLGVIIGILVMRFTPMYASFYAIITIVALSLLQKETRPSPRVLARAFANGAVAGAKIAVTLALVGMMAQTLITTGLGIKLSGAVESFSEGNLLIALPITMFISILMGTGIPTVAAYSLVAMVVCPVLVKMGALPIAAHFFAFYFAIISALTPPVALAALTGSAIAGGNFWATCWKSFRLSIIGFIIPYLFIFNPVVLGHFSDPLLTVVTLIAIIGAIIAITAVLYGHLATVVTPWERLLFALSAGALFVGVMTQNYLFFGAGILLLMSPILHQVRSSQPTKAETGVPQSKK